MLVGSSSSLQAEDLLQGGSKAEIEGIVREYILRHPEVLMESVRAYQEREHLEAQRRSKDAIAMKRRELFDDAASPVAGSANADIAIVQFFDYKCGYCRRVSPIVAKLLEEHKNVRMIYKELPILGPESHLAARAALAAAKQGAYLRFHQELLSLNGPITPAVIEETGKKLQLDVAKLKADIGSKYIEALIIENQRLASAIGIQSTPSFVIGDELVSGALDRSRFEELIAKNSSR
jgi:protein-disulfide isomerase